jgi:hypothetical protein
MLDSQVKAIITEPFYKFPYWLRKDSEYEEYKEYFILCKDASIDDVDLFLAKLFRCNKIDVRSNPSKAFNQLVKEAVQIVPFHFEDDRKSSQQGF